MLRDLIIERLKAAVPALKNVSTAADLASAKTDAKQFPCAYVLTLAEQGGSARYMTGLVAQQRIPRIGVVLAVRNVRDGIGGAASGDMDALRQQVDAVLFGWKPDAANPNAGYEALIFSSGKLLALIDGEVWWQDEYSTEFDRR